MKTLIKCWMLLALLFLPGSIPAQTDFAADLNRLREEVDRRFRDPAGEPKELAPYLEALQAKAKDRDEVEQLYIRLQAADLADHLKTPLLGEFELLYSKAQRSGNYTVERAVKNCLEWTGYWKSDYWRNALSLVKTVGRPLLNGTLSTSFNADPVRKAARCHLNFAIGDVETGKMGLYHGREAIFGEVDEEGMEVLPDREFNVRCEARGNFMVLDRGMPQADADTGLVFVDEIRQECRWPGWNASDLYDDATDLMNEFFKDVMCILPEKKGHRWFGELARKYDGMESSVAYNEDFYGTLEGLVEWESETGREPAVGAEVVLYIPKDEEEVSTTSGPDGTYRIEQALLHRACSPFKVTAQQYESTDNWTFLGILEEPDPSAVHRENLVLTLWPVLTITREVIYEGGVSGRFVSTAKGPVKLSKGSGAFEFNMPVTLEGNRVQGSAVSTLQGSGRLHGSGQLQADRNGRDIFLDENTIWALNQSWEEKTSMKDRVQIFNATHLFEDRTNHYLNYSVTGQSEICSWSGNGTFDFVKSEIRSLVTICCPKEDPPCVETDSPKFYTGGFPVLFLADAIVGLPIAPLEWKDGSEQRNELPFGMGTIKMVYRLQFRKKPGG